jgi:ornithine carbamoyltransferase
MPPDTPPAVNALENRDAQVAGAAGPQALRGRNVGILCDDPRRPEAVLLQQAASTLGARVALVRSDLDETSGPVQLEHTARVLGRLYDAVVCVALPASIVARLRDAAGIPVIADDRGDWDRFQAPATPAMAAIQEMLLARLAGL